MNDTDSKNDPKAGLGRRDIFKLAVIGSAAASAQACAPAAARRPVGPEKKVVSACGFCAAGCGITVRCVGTGSQDAVQVTGALGHPVNDAGICPQGIASLQHLYSPDRLRGSLARSTRAAAFSPVGTAAALTAAAGKLTAGSPVTVALGRVPAAEELIVRLLAAKIGASVVDVSVPYGAAPTEAFTALLGGPDFSFDLPRADLVFSLGFDWLQAHGSALEAQRAFGALRSGKVRGLLATASPRLSTTAAKSDLWLPVAQHQLGFFGVSLIAAVLAKRPELKSKLPQVAALAAEARFQPDAAAKTLGLPPARLQRAVQELLDRKNPVVIADRSDPGAQAAAVALDLLLGAVGREGGVLQRHLPAFPAELTAPAQAAPALTATPAAVILWQSNPDYVAPAVWREALNRAPFVASFGTLTDESAQKSDVVVALSTPLECKQLSWGATLDGKAFATGGPAVVPVLHDTLEPIEAALRLAQAIGKPLPWRDAAAFQAAVASTLGAGADKLVAKGGSTRPEFAAAAPALPATGDAWAADALKASIATQAPAGLPLSLSVVSPLAFPQGFGAHLPYLHGLASTGGRELWVTAVELHPSTAAAAKVREGHKVVVESAAGSMEGIARLREGVRPGSVAIALGLGRKGVGRFADGHGGNPLELSGPFVRVKEIA